MSYSRRRGRARVKVFISEREIQRANTTNNWYVVSKPNATIYIARSLIEKKGEVKEAHQSSDGRLEERLKKVEDQVDAIWNAHDRISSELKEIREEIRLLNRRVNMLSAGGGGSE